MSHPIKIPTPAAGSARSLDEHEHDHDHDDHIWRVDRPTVLEGTLHDGEDSSSTNTGRSPALTLSGGLAASLSELNGSLSALDEGLAAMRRRASGGRRGNDNGHGNGNGSDPNDSFSSSSFHPSGEIPVGSLPDNRLERRRQILASGEGGSAGAAISGVAAASAAAAAGAGGAMGVGVGGGSRRSKRGTRTDASFGGLGGTLGGTASSTTSTTSTTSTMPTMAYSYTGGGRGLPSRRPMPPRAPALHAQADSSNRLARMPQMSLPESALEHTDFGAGPSSVPVTTAYGSLNDCSFQKYARSRMMQHGSARMRAAQQIHHFNKGGGSPIMEGAEHEFGNGGGGGGGQGEGETNAIGGPVAGGIAAVGGGIGAASLPPDYHSDLVRKRWEDATAGSAAAGGGSNKPSPLVLGMDGGSGGGIEIGAAPSPLNPGKKQSSLSAQLNDLALAPSAASSTSDGAGVGGLAGALNLGLGASASTESPVGGGGGSGADYGSAGLGRPRGDGSFSDNSYGGGDAGGGGDGPASVTSLTALEILSSSRQSLERRLGSPVGGGAAASSGLSPGAAAANFDMAMGDHHHHQQQQHPAGGVGAHFLPDQPNLYMQQPLQQQLPDVVPFEYSENPPAEKDHLTDDEGAFDLDM